MEGLVVFLFYLLLFLFLFWSYAGYIFVLAIIAKGKKTRNIETKATIFPVTIVIPCLNEEALIRAKIRNLLALDYPESFLKIVFVDGGSTDNTAEIIKTAVLQNQKMSLVETKLRNKVKQINKVLAKIKTEIVVINDVDGKLHPQAIKNIAKEFGIDSKTAVVGAYTCPKKAIPLEAVYWQKQNQLRLLESRALSSSIVIANCYGFRRNLLFQFPEDVVADDIYVAFLAQSKGLRVRYLEKALAFELRTPQNFSEFFCHKFRKGHAYIREIFRFFPKSILGGWQWRIVYFTKLLQAVCSPLLAIAFWLLTVRSFLLGNLVLPAFLVFLLFLATAGASQILQQVTPRKRLVPSVALTAASFFLVNLILFSALLVYPFYKQTASYRRLDQEVS